MSYTTTANGLKLRGDIKFFYSVPTEYAPAEVAFDSSTQDLVSDAGLETAILIMLFSDKRASVDDVLPDSLSNDRRGWWGDTLLEENIGSKLWLLSREKTLSTLHAKIEAYTLDALQPLIKEKIAKNISVAVTRVGSSIYKTNVKITRAAEQDVLFTYYYNWVAQTIGGSNAI